MLHSVKQRGASRTAIACQNAAELAQPTMPEALAYFFGNWLDHSQELPEQILL